MNRVHIVDCRGRSKVTIENLNSIAELRFKYHKTKKPLTIHVLRCGNLTSLGNIGDLENLHELRLCHLKSLEDITPVLRNINIHKLSLVNLPKVLDFKHFMCRIYNELHNLKFLKIKS